MPLLDSLLGVSLLLLLLLLDITRGELRLESELTSNCFDFPRQNFDPQHSVQGVHGVTPYMLLEAGADAIDFTLHDLDGQAWRLSAAMEKGLPVILIWACSHVPFIRDRAHIMLLGKKVHTGMSMIC